MKKMTSVKSQEKVGCVELNSISVDPDKSWKIYLTINGKKGILFSLWGDRHLTLLCILTND